MGNYYYLRFTDGETDAQKVKAKISKCDHCFWVAHLRHFEPEHSELQQLNHGNRKYSAPLKKSDTKCLKLSTQKLKYPKIGSSFENEAVNALLKMRQKFTGRHENRIQGSDSSSHALTLFFSLQHSVVQCQSLKGT